jgi:murein L,D-transpeptidase YcbB/YkuD
MSTTHTTDRFESDPLEYQPLDQAQYHTDASPRERIERRVAERARARRRRTALGVAAGATIAVIAAGMTWLVLGAASASGTTQPSAAAVQPTSTSTDVSVSSTQGYQHGAWVATLQRDLAQLNYYQGPIDGIYGAAATSAVEAFQSANGLTVDGIAGPQTMAAINAQLASGDNHIGPSQPETAPMANVTPANPPMANLTPATQNGGSSSQPSGGTSTTGSGAGANGATSNPV